MKAHESEIIEIAEEAKLSLGGPLALVSKVSGKVTEFESTENDGSDNEVFIRNSYDEAVSYYSNNKVMKFYKTPFKPTLKEVI